MNLKDLQLAEIPPQNSQRNYGKEPIRKNGCNQYKILVGYSIIECEHCDHLDSENIAKNITVSDLDKQSFIYDFKTSKVVSLSRLNGISSVDVLYSEKNSKDFTADETVSIPEEDACLDSDSSDDDQSTVRIMPQNEAEEDAKNVKIYCECKTLKSPADEEAAKTLSKNRCTEDDSHHNGERLKTSIERHDR